MLDARRTRQGESARIPNFLFLLALCISWVGGVDLAKAHNNPGFKEVLLTTIEVSDQSLDGYAVKTFSEPFALDLPKKTIELIWRIKDDAGDEVTFTVAQGDTVHAEGLADGSNSRILRDDDVRIVDVVGAAATFTIEIYANVIDRSKASVKS